MADGGLCRLSAPASSAQTRAARPLPVAVVLADPAPGALSGNQTSMQTSRPWASQPGRQSRPVARLQAAILRQGPAPPMLPPGGHRHCANEYSRSQKTHPLSTGCPSTLWPRCLIMQSAWSSTGSLSPLWTAVQTGSRPVQIDGNDQPIDFYGFCRGVACNSVPVSVTMAALFQRTTTGQPEKHRPGPASWIRT